MIDRIALQTRGLSASDLDASTLWDLLESATDGLWWLDSASGSVRWSPGLFRTLGLEPARDATPPDVLALTHPDDLDRHRRMLEDTRRPGGRYRLLLRLAHADGGWVWMQAQGLWLAARGRITGLIGFVFDVSEQEQARRSLERSEERFRTFIERCPAAVYVKGRDGRFRMGNGRAAELAGVPPVDFVGAREADLFTSETVRSLEASDRSVLEEGRAQEWSGELEPLAGPRRTLLNVKFPVPDLETGETLIGGFGVDVTELREAQQRLLSARRLEGLGLLAGGIAHDFNNVLVGILGHAELARETASPELAEHLDAIRRAARHATDLCDQLLMTAGRREARHRVVDPAAFLQESRDLLRMAAGSDAVTDVRARKGTAPCRVDPGQLRRVLINMVRNAAEADRSRVTRVRIACGPLDRAELGRCVVCHDHLPGDAGEALVGFRIEDDGPGLDEDELQRVFDPFYSTKPSGHGLGLATVLGIVRANGGAVAVQPRPSGGLRFHVAFPAHLEQGAPASGTADDPGIREGATGTTLEGQVLVVDDEFAVADVLCRFLERFGLSARSCSSGEEALADLARNARAPDLVVLDMTMPRLSGRETLERIRGRWPDLPVLLCSGFGGDDLRLDEGDRTGFLRKPFTRDQLHAAVRELLP